MHQSAFPFAEETGTGRARVQVLPHRACLHLPGAQVHTGAKFWQDSPKNHALPPTTYFLKLLFEINAKMFTKCYQIVKYYVEETA